MTVASECVLAGELGIAYATICVVDNLANGVGGAPLAVEDFEAGKATNRERLLAAIGAARGRARGRAMSGSGGATERSRSTARRSRARRRPAGRGRA